MRTLCPVIVPLTIRPLKKMYSILKIVVLTVLAHSVRSHRSIVLMLSFDYAYGALGGQRFEQNALGFGPLSAPSNRLDVESIGSNELTHHRGDRPPTDLPCRSNSPGRRHSVALVRLRHCAYSEPKKVRSGVLWVAWVCGIVVGCRPDRGLQGGSEKARLHPKCEARAPTN